MMVPDLKSLVLVGDGEVRGHRRRRSSFLPGRLFARDWRLKWRVELLIPSFVEIGPRTNTSVQPTNHIILAHPSPTFVSVKSPCIYCLFYLSSLRNQKI